MRWSTMHIPTLRDDPADAGAPSHRLLLRAGYMRPLMAGHYSLLPLGQRVRLKVIAIIREEMDRIGAQEILMPVMHPAELWQLSGRWQLMGDEMFRLKDRRGADLALGMTHEEIVTSLSAELESYRELPQMWYQIQTKLRDEPRPKAGLMRTREFTMKDSYSFDLDADGLDVSFRLHRDAYTRIFERLSIPAIPVEASSGAMGGSDSTEFVCPSPSGEDLIVLCPECGYAANIEKATSGLAAVDDSAERTAALPNPEPFATPGVRTIEDLATGYQAPADRQIKTLVYFLDDVLTLVLLRGDHALNEQKLVDATGATAIRPAQPEEIRDALGALPGSLGAVGVGNHPVIADEALRGPARHVHRRQRRRHPPARRGRRTRHPGEPVGRPARGRRGPAVRQLRARPGGAARHRGRPHLQARLQVHRRHADPGVRPGRQAGQADHGLLRHRRRAGHGHRRRGSLRRQGHHLAGRDRPVRGRGGDRAAG